MSSHDMASHDILDEAKPLRVRGGSRADAEGAKMFGYVLSGKCEVLRHYWNGLDSASTDSLTLSSIHFWNSSGPRTVTNPRMWA
jgi:hypothetical protein